MSQRILFATIGSLGDLNPCIALGLELRRRGHQIVVASTPAYRTTVESLGLNFHAIRPDWQPDDAELIARCEDLKSGPEVLFRKLILPHLEETYTDLLSAAKTADLMIAGELVFAAPLVAEKLDMLWASAILSPISFFSAHDPSLLVNAPWLLHLRGAGWRVNKAALDLGTAFTRHWWNPVKSLRKREGLRPECSPLLRDKFSPHLVLAMFSAELGKPQPANRGWQSAQDRRICYERGSHRAYSTQHQLLRGERKQLYGQAVKHCRRLRDGKAFIASERVDCKTSFLN